MSEPFGLPDHEGQSPIFSMLQQILAAQRSLGEGLAEIQSRLTNLEKTMSSNADSVGNEISTLTSDVTAQTSVIQSAIALINGIQAQIQAAVAAAMAAGATPEQLQALSNLGTQLQTNTSSLAQAVAANTPAPSGSASVGSPPSGTPTTSAPKS